MQKINNLTELSTRQVNIAPNFWLGKKDIPPQEVKWLVIYGNHEMKMFDLISVADGFV